MKVPSTPTIIRDLFTLKSTLEQFHPLVVEGHTKDSRDADTVANQIIQNLNQHWTSTMTSTSTATATTTKKNENNKPILLVSQGDPLTEKGISAITRQVATKLGVNRLLVCLDEDIDPQHSILADRQNVIYEIKYSQLIDILHEYDDEIVKRIEDSIDERIITLNEKRLGLGKEPLHSWYKTYALLQEVTKMAMKVASGSVTVAHSIDEIQEFSVTSFYEVGLGIGLIDRDNDMVPYSYV